jgi:hypothetical protein
MMKERDTTNVWLAVVGSSICLLAAALGLLLSGSV